MTVPAAALRAAAARWGTPLYVTDLDVASSAAERWTRAVPGALVAYAVKANPDPALLARLAADGIGAEVVGPVELALALRAGIAPDRIVVNGAGQTDDDLRAALASRAVVNAESLDALRALLAADRGGRIGLRLNPGLDAKTHPHLATGSAGSKFGIAMDELAAAADLLRGAGVRPASVGGHIGSAIDDPAPFGRLAALLRPVADELRAERIDLGGGFTGDANRWASEVLPHVGAARMIVEPGRTVVRDAGWLLTRIVRIQARGQLVADAGMTELLRPMLYGATHPVTLLEPGEALPHGGPWTLSGPICEAGDVLAGDVELGAQAGAGALLAIGEAGAYGAAMASNYNGRLRPAQVVLEGGLPRLSRRRETLADVVGRDAG